MSLLRIRSAHRIILSYPMDALNRYVKELVQCIIFFRVCVLVSGHAVDLEFLKIVNMSVGCNKRKNCLWPVKFVSN